MKLPMDDERILECLAASQDADRKAAALESDVERGPAHVLWEHLAQAVTLGVIRGWVEHSEFYIDHGPQMKYRLSERGDRALEAYRRRLGKGRFSA